MWFMEFESLIYYKRNEAMANFKILKIKVLRPEEEFLLKKKEDLEAEFGTPVQEEIALRVARYQNIHKCLVPGTEYRLADNERPLPDNFFSIKADMQESDRDIDISVSAIVGQNGSGKSTLLEVLIRLFNNVAFALQRAYDSNPAIPLQFVDEVYAELTYQMPENEIYKLEQKGTVLRCLCKEQEIWKYDNNRGNLITVVDAINCLKDCFFFTITLNYSAYSYNIYNYRPEWREIPPNNKLDYTDEDRCWLSALFHKNDAYQTPIVLNPFRSFGEIDFNNEANLTRDRLFLLSVQNVDMLSVLIDGLRTHSIVFDTQMSLVEQPRIAFSSSRLVDVFVQLRNITNSNDVRDTIYKRCQRLCDIVIKAWCEIVGLDLTTPSQNNLLQRDVSRAKNYLVYKTIKTTQNYAMYSSFRQCFMLPRDADDDELEVVLGSAEMKIPQLVKELWEDQTHVTLKIHKTLAFLKFKHYHMGMGNEDGLGIHQISAQRYNDIIEGLYQKLGGDEQKVWKREYLLPAPCFDARLIMSQKKRDNNGIVIPGEETQTELNSRSSGEMQLLYSLTTVLYHLKNVDSNITSGKNALRYPCVNLIFDEMELYYHPNFQKDFLYNMLYAIRKMKYQGIKAINIIIATHSPYILSDIPKNNVLCLDNGNVYQNREQHLNNTFAANVYDILNSRFFMNDFVGKFAYNKLDEIIMEVNAGEQIAKDEYDRKLNLVELIGDEFIKEKLKEELMDKLINSEKRQIIETEISRLERKRQYLTQKLEEDIDGGIEI